MKMSETTALARRFSDRNLKRKRSTSISEKTDKKTRNCDKAGCLLETPTCCLRACDSCSVSGYTSRWYHMSLGEHFCNNCFDNYYRSGKAGNQQYSSWSHQWADIARASKPTIKRFVANELLPYWLQCVDCNKWRSVREIGALESNFIKNFKCTSDSNEMSACDVIEDKNVIEAKDPPWMMQLVEEPLLKKSPAGPFLKRFLSEDIGLSPTDCSESVFKKLENIEPFYVGQCGESSIWVKPDEMESDEAEFAKKALIFSPTYLGLRNLIVTVWNMSPEWLTVQQAQKYIICRGLVRVYLVTIAEQIINLLTKKGVINYGILECPPENRLMQNRREKVVIVGAGISGLAAARHLTNLGLDVVVLEAKSNPLGRIYQDPVIKSDAIFVQGLTNNPFTVMANQAKISIQVLENSYLVFDYNGKQIPFTITERVDHELYGLIHGAIEGATLYNKDSNWYDTIMKNYKEIRSMSLSFRKPDIFHLFLNQYEIEQRADLNELSLLSWEFITPLMGNDGIIPDGVNSLASHLTHNLNILNNWEVKSIDYSDNEIRIVNEDKIITASHVLVTIPVSILRSDEVSFNPPLPEFKTKALNEVGDCYCEKLIMEFPKRFWTRKIKERFGKFSVVSPEEIFFLFVDITFEKKNSVPTLMTYISQRSIVKMINLDDEMIVKKCVSLLKTIFSCDGNVPEPTKWLLTRWSEDAYGGSYGSFVKVDGTQNCFDELAKTVNNKIYFAGEGTFRNMPSTISGAYLSGLREAAKIVQYIESL